MTARISVVMPVFNRTVPLRRALDSLVAQEFDDFECLIVDDASTVPIQSVVDEYDDRFRYYRSRRNLGPAGARRIAFENLESEIMCRLDSDNTLFPWALGRIAVELDARPTVSGISGLFVFDSELRVRVDRPNLIFSPALFNAGLGSQIDMVGAVRTAVVREWLKKSSEYYALEFHQWLTYHRSHLHLMVDEPWGTYYSDGGGQVTSNEDPRKIADIRVFVEEHRPSIGSDPCVPLDRFLSCELMRILRRGRLSEARLIHHWLSERGVKVSERVNYWRNERSTPALVILKDRSFPHGA